MYSLFSSYTRATAPIAESVLAAAFVLIVATVPRQAHAQNPGFYTPRDVRIEQRLQAQIPLDAPFVDETGRPVTLGAYFGTKPVLLNMIFYRCAGVCTLELDGLVKAFRKMDLRPGKDFEVVTVSIDPKEGPELAIDKQESYIAELGRPEAKNGWHFLTGPRESITRLAQAVGFHYKHNPKDNSFAHSAALMVSTPEGKLSRYFYGANYNPRDLGLAVVEASEGKIGSPAQEVFLLLCHFDPVTGRYGLAITRLLQVFGVLTVVVLVGSLTLMSVRSSRAADRAAASAAAGEPSPDAGE